VEKVECHTLLSCSVKIKHVAPLIHDGGKHAGMHACSETLELLKHDTVGMEGKAQMHSVNDSQHGAGWTGRPGDRGV